MKQDELGLLEMWGNEKEIYFNFKLDLSSKNIIFGLPIETFMLLKIKVVMKINGPMVEDIVVSQHFSVDEYIKLDKNSRLSIDINNNKQIKAHIIKCKEDAIYDFIGEIKKSIRDKIREEKFKQKEENLV